VVEPAIHPNQLRDGVVREVRVESFKGLLKCFGMGRFGCGGATDRIDGLGNGLHLRVVGEIAQFESGGWTF